MAGAGLLAAFVAWERTAVTPLVRIELLRVRSLRAASLGAAVNAISFTGIVYVGTLYLQDELRYSPLMAGAALLPVDAVALVVSLLAGGVVAHRSPRALLSASFALTAIGLLWLARARTPASYVPDVMAPLVLLGAPLSLAFVVLTTRGRRRDRARRVGRRIGHLRDRQPPPRRSRRRRRLRDRAPYGRLPRRVPPRRRARGARTARRRDQRYTTRTGRRRSGHRLLAGALTVGGDIAAMSAAPRRRVGPPGAAGISGRRSG